MKKLTATLAAMLLPVLSFASEADLMMPSGFAQNADTKILYWGFLIVVIGLIGTWINGIVVDYFTAGLNNRKRVCIISPQYKHIQDFIISDLQRGVTMYDVTGGYSNQKKVEIEALLTKDEFSKLMNHINENGINAFITAGNVSEVYGLWASKKEKTKQERVKL